VVDMLPTLNSSVSSWSSRFERAASCSCTATDELTAGEAYEQGAAREASAESSAALMAADTDLDGPGLTGVARTRNAEVGAEAEEEEGTGAGLGLGEEERALALLAAVEVAAGAAEPAREATADCDCVGSCVSVGASSTTRRGGRSEAEEEEGLGPACTSADLTGAGAEGAGGLCWG
jgi:hypothetical protein